jgi:peptide/nickel transport system ATP-binding protein
MSEQSLLSVRGLTRDFTVGRGRRLSAVADARFEIGQGEAFALVGESGSGKTTLARMLVGLLPPSGGDASFDGISLVHADRRSRRELRRRIQIVFQDPQSSLDPRMRLDTIVAEGLYHARLDRRARRTRVAELLELVGLTADMARNYPHQLSGGQRQRVGIARALAAEPDLLVADEPVSALDASVQGQILNLLRRLQRERNLALIFVAHELSVARYMSDRVAVMQLGRIVETGPSDAVFARPTHPYTQALMSAAPAYGQDVGERIVLAGDAPSPIDPPDACRFAGRCWRRLERCVASEPPLEPGPDDDQLVACFNWETSDEGSRWTRNLSSS